ncbi:MAG TPA: DUF484 family protein [Steroidobacteraceae bacterium]|nr:DUF484 family protein [Steroidobacteraceae bacterium]
MTNPQAKVESKKLPRGTGPDEASIVAYLMHNPEFFDRHAALLAGLRLPHVRGDGTTVSLVERQVDVLRERIREAELRLKTLVDNGRVNDVLADKIHRLACRLVHARDARLRLGLIEASLREDFGAREFVIVLTRREAALAGVEARCLRFVTPEDPGLRSFESLFNAAKPRCGRMRDSQRDYLFPSADIAIGSVALVPLGPGGGLGLLAIASPDADHFNPTMSTEFLARIGELVAIALDGAQDQGG